MITVQRAPQIMASSGLLGSGTHGAIIADGTTTLAAPFGAPTAGVYTLSGDVHATSVLVAAGATVYTNGYIINAKGAVTVAGVVHANGNSVNPAFPATKPAQQFGGTVKPGRNGTDGVTGTGAAGTAATQALGGASGTGGAGASGAGASAATATAPTNAEGGLVRPKQMPQGGYGLLTTGTGTFLYPWYGGASGGSGAGDGVNKGGAGANGGGLVIINCTDFVLSGSGTVTALGGSGGTPTTGNCGGGAPGGGGAVIINCTRYTGAQLVAATVCAPGTPGNGVGTGTAGGAGSPGNVFITTYT